MHTFRSYIEQQGSDVRLLIFDTRKVITKFSTKNEMN